MNICTLVYVPILSHARSSYGLLAHELCSDTYSTGCTPCPHNPEVLETVTLFHALITQIRIPIGGLREGRPIYPVLGAEAGLHG